MPRIPTSSFQAARPNGRGHERNVGAGCLSSRLCALEGGGGLGQFRAPFSEFLVMLCWCMTVVVFGTCFLVYMMCWVPRTCFIDQVYNLIHVHVHSRARFDKLYQRGVTVSPGGGEGGCPPSRSQKGAGGLKGLDSSLFTLHHPTITACFLCVQLSMCICATALRLV